MSVTFSRHPLPEGIMSTTEPIVSTDASAGTCPVAHSGGDDRKSALAAQQGLKPFHGARISGSFNFSREILRSPAMRQAGAKADDLVVDNPDHVSFFFLDGDLHRRRRASNGGCRQEWPRRH